MTQEVLDWFHSIEKVVAYEDENLILKDATRKTRSVYLQMVRSAIASGEELEATQKTRDENLSAAIEHLKDQKAMWGSRMSKRRKEEILSAVFGPK